MESPAHDLPDLSDAPADVRVAIAYLKLHGNSRHSNEGVRDAHRIVARYLERHADTVSGAPRFRG